MVLAAGLGCYPKGWIGARKLYLEPREFPFEVGPYLVLLDEGAVAVVIKHADGAAPVVEFAAVSTTQSATVAHGTQSATVANSAWPAKRVVATDIDGLWVAAVEQLPLGQTMRYTVESDLGDYGPIEFVAGRARGAEFRFAAFGDTRSGHKVHRALVEQMSRENIDFVVHSGDLVESGGFEEQWDLFWRIESPVVSRRPMFAAVGNHDESQRGNFRRYFLNELWADGHRYYYRDWGDVRVVVMDSELEARAGSPQYEFLDAALAEGAAKGQLMVIALHYPPYSSGSHGSYPEMREVLGELAPRYGVEAVLAGHDHNYERTVKIDGVTYFVAASGGANIRKVTPQKFSAVMRTEPHYLLFDVERGSLVGRTINLYGDVFDTFVLTDNPPRPGAR